MTTAVFSSAAFSASPLHELTTTPGPTLVCGNVVVHANAAIAYTQHADDAISRSLVRLRTVDFDSAGVVRKQSVNDLLSAVTEIHAYTDRAKLETARLRIFADHPAGDDRKSDLDAFTKELDAALDRQRESARVIDAFVRGVLYLDLGAKEITTLDPAGPEAIGALRPSNVPGSLSAAAAATSGPTGTYSARASANEVQERITEIEADEAQAATHSEPAIGGC